MSKPATIRTAAQRAKLKPRNEPYWHKLALGQAIGYRRPTTGSPSWKARLHRRNEYTHATFDGALEFADALALAQQFFVGTGTTSSGMDTVAAAARDYVKTRPALAGWHQRLIHADDIGDIELAKLQPHHVRDWVERHHTEVVGTLNRRKGVLRAVLRHALDDRAVESDWAWRKALRAAEEKAKRSPITDAQLQALRPFLARLEPLVEFLAICPLRVGAAVELEAGDLVADVLTVRKDKAGAGRQITLAGQALELLRQACKDKLPRAKMFDVVGRPDNAFRIAVKAAGLPTGLVLYSLRHRAISDMLARGVPAFTVATIAGTSVARIDSNYGHDKSETQRRAFQ